jgi:MFS family permease
MTALSEAAEETGLHQGFAAGLGNMAWATGQVVGTMAGGATAAALGNAAPFLVISLLLVATAAYAYRQLEQAAPARPQVA